MIFGRKYTEKIGQCEKLYTAHSGTSSKVTEYEHVYGANVLIMGICDDCRTYKELLRVSNIFGDKRKVCRVCAANYSYYLRPKGQGLAFFH